MVLKWGSSKETKILYLRPFVLCQMYVATSDETIAPKKIWKDIRTCPFCKGSIIKNDTITDKNTLIVRRYKTKNKITGTMKKSQTGSKEIFQ